MIIIIRHGETIWNIKKRKQGHKNSKLTSKGKKQAIKIANFLNDKNFELENFIFYASPLKRVKDTIRIVFDHINSKCEKKIIFLNSLKEHKFGVWEGKTDSEIKKLFFDQVKKRKLDRWNYKIPNGESYFLLNKRIKKFKQKKINLKKNYIIFTHEMVSKVFRGLIMKYDNKKTLHLKHKNSSIFIYDKKRFKEFKI